MRSAFPRLAAQREVRRQDVVERCVAAVVAVLATVAAPPQRFEMRAVDHGVDLAPIELDPATIRMDHHVVVGANALYLCTPKRPAVSNSPSPTLEVVPLEDDFNVFLQPPTPTNDDQV